MSKRFLRIFLWLAQSHSSAQSLGCSCSPPHSSWDHPSCDHHRRPRPGYLATDHGTMAAHDDRGNQQPMVFYENSKVLRFFREIFEKF